MLLTISTRSLPHNLSDSESNFFHFTLPSSESKSGLKGLNQTNLDLIRCEHLIQEKANKRGIALSGFEPSTTKAFCIEKSELEMWGYEGQIDYSSIVFEVERLDCEAEF